MSTTMDAIKDSFRLSPKRKETANPVPETNGSGPVVDEARREPQIPERIDVKEPMPPIEPLQLDAQVRRQGVSRKATEDLYSPLPSFVDHMPWVEAIEGKKAILLEDNNSVGAVFEILPRGTEGRTEEYLLDVRDTIEDALQDVFDEHETCPWVLQTYTFNEPQLTSFMSELEDYIRPEARGTEYTKRYLGIVRKHYEGICKPGGLFKDEAVTQTEWGGKRQRNYLVIYRRYGLNYKSDEYDVDTTPLAALDEVCEKLFNALLPVGIGHRRLTGAEFHRWMTRWFNVYTTLDDDDPLGFSNRVNYPEDELVPYGDQFAETMFYSHPTSDLDNKCWTFDETFSRCLTVDGVRKRPNVGQTTGETKRGDAINTMMDQLPEGTVMVSTIVVVPPDVVEAHIEAVDKAAIGDSTDSARTKKDCNTAKDIMGYRHKMYRASYAFYINARSLEELNRNSNKARAVLVNQGFRAIAVKDDVLSLDNYITNLPMKYDADIDRLKGWRKAQLTWVQHIASLSCLFGRSTGTGNPGILQFNRGGSPLVFDPLNKDDRRKNAHMLLVGPTGAGKSASLAGMLTNVMAVYRPRMFIIEAGNSFGLMADWYRSLGLTVNIVSMKPGSAPPLPTFRDAKLVIGTRAEHATLEEDEFGIDETAEVEDDDDDQNVERDILGEMEIIATLMITGGEEKEAELLRRSDRRVIRDAILLAGRKTADAGVETLTEHVVDAFLEISRDEERPPDARQRIREMGESMALFCDGFTGQIFNTPGKPWPESDVTLIDLAHFAREGYEAHLAISVISMLNMINNIAERDQHNAREIVVTIDEAHIITTNPLLSPYLVKIVKMWRKLGAWLWLATQNIDDFPGSSKKLLNMIEWWICLVMPKEEVEQIESFKQLTEEQKTMLMSASKADRQFTEGVVLSSVLQVLFRTVPPSFILALAMTEKHEKAARAKIMAEKGISEVQAAALVASEIDHARGIR